MDDKAICVAGPLKTSVGRYIHRSRFHLKAFNLNYPHQITQKTGFASPGVILLITNIKKVPYNGTDKIVREDVTVTVTCKPKKLYCSSATNWFNDL